MKINNFLIILFFLFYSNIALADEASDWLKDEIDNILNAYQNADLSDEDRFLKIEDTINNNFAGTGIARFVAGNAWKLSDKDTKLEYIKNFKRHLALNIASMMRGYSNQKYKLNTSIAFTYFYFVEKNNCLRFLHRDGKKVSPKTHVKPYK